MDFGLMLPTKANSWEVVKRGEELGFTHGWFYDTHMLNAEVFAAMGAAAMMTKKIKLCAGVLIPGNRIAPVAASGLATLNALAPGRVVFGSSTGYTARRTMGRGPITLAQLEEYVKVVEGLLAGKTVEWTGEGKTTKVAFLDPKQGLVNIKDPIPTFLSAFGPKARRLTAKLGASWIGSVTWPEREQEEFNEYKKAWTEFGHPASKLYASLGCGGCVLDEGEPADSPRARAQAGPFAAIAFHNLVEEEEFGSVFPVGDHFPCKEELEAYRKVYLSYKPADARYLSNHKGHLMYLRPDEKHISAKVISILSFTGTKQQLVERIRGMKAIGFKQIAVNMPPGHETDMMQRLSDVMAAV